MFSHRISTRMLGLIVCMAAFYGVMRLFSSEQVALVIALTLRGILIPIEDNLAAGADRMETLLAQDDQQGNALAEQSRSDHAVTPA